MKTILFLIGIVVGIWLSYFTVWITAKRYMKEHPRKCQFSGVTLIQRGVGVTNCGDTIVVEMPGDLYKEFKEKN